MEYAKESGARVIAITDSENSPIAKGSYATLTARSDMVSFVDSLVAPLSIINALLAAVAQKKETELSATLTKLETVWDAFGVYNESDDSNDAKE